MDKLKRINKRLDEVATLLTSVVGGLQALEKKVQEIESGAAKSGKTSKAKPSDEESK